MKTLLTIIIFFNITMNYSQSWYAVNTNTTDDLNDIFFFSDTEGYIVSEQGTILQTTDTGENWQSIYSNPNIKFNYICVITDSNEKAKLMAYGSRNGLSTLVYAYPHENDITWNVEEIDYFPKESYSTLPNSINGLDCDNNIIYFLEANEYGKLKKIENNEIILVAEDVEIFGVNNNLVFYVNPNFNSLHYSSDYGTSFSQTTSYPEIYDQNQSVYSKLYPFNDLLMIYCTYPGNLIYSSDHGDTWDFVSSNENYGEIISPNLFFGTYQNQLFIQQDLGEIVHNYTMPEHIRKISFINDEVIFVLGNNGMIYKTTTGGLSVTDLELYDKQITISPNPVQDSISIDYDVNLKIEKIELYNAGGKKVKYYKKHLKMLNVAKFPSGLYYLKITLENGQKITKKVIIE